jgi:endoglucanase
MIVLGLANDLSCAQNNTYLDAMSNGMAYLMGNNPMGISYVTGYGENAVQNPHHRFWAFQNDESYPVPPPGVMSGGPNSTHASTGDPVSLAKVAADCPAETCFIDDIGSWSTNEITINWNSPFAWVVAYMDENLQQGLADDQACQADEDQDEDDDQDEDQDEDDKKGGAGIPLFLVAALIFMRKRQS